MAIRTFGPNSVDWEVRVDMDRLRTERLARLHKTLEESSLGALLCFDFANIRYATATHIGTWAIDKLIRFALIPRGGDPIVWDFGSAARHHQLYNPWLDHGHAHAGSPGESHHDAHGSRPGLSTLRGAIPPGAGLADDVAAKVYDVLAEHGLADEPVGVDLVEMPVLAALTGRGLGVVDGQQVFLEARRIKTPDEILLLTHACSMVDAAYEELYRALRPGVRENECVGLVAKTLLDLGSEYVEGVNAISGERCSPHPHVYSDRIIRPGDPAFFDILHSHNGYRTCYYRTFQVGSASPAQRDAYKICREYIDRAIAIVKPGVTTADICARVAGGHRVRLRRRDGRLRPAVRPRRRPVDLGTTDLQPDDLVRPPRSARRRHGLRPGNLLAGRRRLVGVTHRGGGRRHRRRLRSDHPLPRRRTTRLRHPLLDDRRTTAHPPRITVTPQHRRREAGTRVTARPARNRWGALSAGSIAP